MFSQPCTGNPVLQRTPADTTIDEQTEFSFYETKNMFSDPDSHPLTYKLWYWNNDSSIWTLTLPSWLTVTENDTAFLFSGTTPYVCEDDTQNTLQFRAYNVCGDSSVVSFHVSVQNSLGPMDKGGIGQINLHMHRHNNYMIPLYDYFDEPNGFHALNFCYHIDTYSYPERLLESDPETDFFLNVLITITTLQYYGKREFRTIHSFLQATKAAIGHLKKSICYSVHTLIA